MKQNISAIRKVTVTSDDSRFNFAITIQNYTFWWIMSRRFNFILNRFIFWIEFAEKFDSKCRNLTENAEFWGFWIEFLHFESNFWANSIQKMNQINAIESIAKVQFESWVMITKKSWIITALWMYDVITEVGKITKNWSISKIKIIDSDLDQFVIDL